MNPVLAMTAMTALLGCSEMSLNGRPGEVDSANAMQPGTLVVNVYPGDGNGFLPQTKPILPLQDGSGYPAADITLKDTITLSGFLTAEIAHPWSAAGAPTDPEPFAGTVQLTKSGTVQNVAAHADETGFFSLLLPADSGYDLTITPNDASVTPAHTFGGQSFLQDRDLSQDLSEGSPLFGRVTAEGVGEAKAPLVLTQTAPGPAVSSSVFYTDADGWYVARLADAGAYTLTVQGGLSGVDVVLPSVSTTLDASTDGTAANLEIGAVSSAVVTGSIVDQAAAPVAGATVRLTSTALDGGGDLTADTTTDATGSFVVRVVPGQFRMDVLPAYGDALTPVSTSVTARAGSTDMPAVALAPDRTVTGVVNLPEGGPASGVTVTATEVGWSGYVYTATTDGKGTYTLTFPAVDYTLACAPPVSSGAALTRVDLPLDGDPSVSLRTGVTLAGQISSSAGVSANTVVEVWDGVANLQLGSAITGDDGRFSMLIVAPTVGSDTGGGADSGDAGDTAGSDTAASDSGRDSQAADSGLSDSGSSDSGDSGTGDSATAP